MFIYSYIYAVYCIPDDRMYGFPHAGRIQACQVAQSIPNIEWICDCVRARACTGERGVCVHARSRACVHRMRVCALCTAQKVPGTLQIGEAVFSTAEGVVRSLSRTQVCLMAANGVIAPIKGFFSVEKLNPKKLHHQNQHSLVGKKTGCSALRIQEV